MTIELKVPSVGESITEVEIGEWLKTEGAAVAKDEPVVVIESEKATVELPAPAAGKLTKILKKTGESAKVAETIGILEAGKVQSAGDAQPSPASHPENSNRPICATAADRPIVAIVPLFQYRNVGRTAGFADPVRHSRATMRPTCRAICIGCSPKWASECCAPADSN